MLRGLQAAQSEICVPSALMVEPWKEMLRVLLTAVTSPETVAVMVSFAAQGSVWLNVRRKLTVPETEAPFAVLVRRKLPRPEVAAGYARRVIAGCGMYVSTNEFTPGPVQVRDIPEAVQLELLETLTSNAPVVEYRTFLLSSRSRAVTSYAMRLFVPGMTIRLLEL